MSTVSVVVTPPGSSPIDITGDCVFARSSFESQFNGVPGTFQVYVRDPNFIYSFTTGSEIALTVDSKVMFGGYVTAVGMTSFADAADVSSPDYDLYLWHLTGSDYNIVLDRRVFRNTDDYLKVIQINSNVDGETLREAIQNYADMDDFSISGIDNVATIPDATFVTIQQGATVRSQFENRLLFSGAVYYVAGDKTITYKAFDDVEKRWGFSDAPNNNPITASPASYQGALYGFSAVEGTEDGTVLANDVFIWGGSEFAGTGTTVFHRATDQTSIDAHQRWQHAETHFGEDLFRSQKQVTLEANTILSGPPGVSAFGETKGLKFPQWSFTFTWNSTHVPTLSGFRDHIMAGDLVTVNLSAFATTKLLPVRTLRISFPDAFENDGSHLVVFEGTFGLQLSDSYTLWRYMLKNQNRVVTQTQQTVTSTPTGTPSTPTPSYGSNFSGNVTPAADSSVLTFSIPYGYISGTTQVYLNGLLQNPGIDYTESDPAAGQITFTTAPAFGAWIFVTASTVGAVSAVPAGNFMTTYPVHAEYNIDGDPSVTIENVTITGGSLSVPSGIAITIANVTGPITIRNVDFRDKIGGIFIRDCTGTLTIENVRGENIGNVNEFGPKDIGSGHGNFIQMGRCVFVGHISGCQFRGGRSEDMLSIFQTGGAGIGQELVVENNHFQNLLVDDAGARAWISDSGTGTIIGDGAGDSRNGNVIVRNNTYLDPAQIGIAIIDGPNIQVYGNVIVGEQKTHSNVPIGAAFGNPSGSVHNNTYYWLNAGGSPSGPFNGAGTLSFYSNTQDPSLNPADYEINF